MNSPSWSCLTINTISDIKKDNGMNFGAKPKMFNEEYKKYVEIGQPLSTIKSKKLTALTVKAIREKPNNIKKNVVIISNIKFK